MSEAITLIGHTWVGSKKTLTCRDVFAGLKSIGQTEFYQANAQDIHPEGKFVLADGLDYEGETLLLHGDTVYRVLRTYRAGQELELVVERASAEETAEAKEAAGL